MSDPNDTHESEADRKVREQVEADRRGGRPTRPIPMRSSRTGRPALRPLAIHIRPVAATALGATIRPLAERR